MSLSIHEIANKNVPMFCSLCTDEIEATHIIVENEHYTIACEQCTLELAEQPEVLDGDFEVGSPMIINIFPAEQEPNV